MKRLLFLLAVAGLAFGTGCLEKRGAQTAAANGVLYRHHFIGSDAVSRSDQATELKKILALPATKNLREYALPLLSRAPGEFWRQPTDVAALAKPLWQDLMAAESYVEVRGPNARLESVIAIKLSEERASLWQTNLWQWARAWQAGTPVAAQIEGFTGWELKKSGAPNLFQCVRARGWLVAGAGTDQLALLPALLRQVQKTGRPTPDPTNQAILNLEADWPRLGTWFPKLAAWPLPPTQLTLIGRGANVRTEARFRYATPLPKLEPWRFPTNVINDPLISFAVGQGVAPLLSQFKGVADFGLKPLPNQFCAWALASVPWQHYVATPVSRASNAVQRMAPTLPQAVFDHFGEQLGDIVWVSNRAEIRWHGLPFVIPSVRAINDEYLLWSIFPLLQRTNPPPPELFRQLGNPHLVYYHWEITQESLKHKRQLSSLFNVIKRWQVKDLKAPTVEWLEAITPLLGNTVTEITQTGPNELSLTRGSHLGLTGAELVMFSRWLESPGFPLRWERPPSWEEVRATNTLRRVPRGTGPQAPGALKAPLAPAKTNSPATPQTR